jgi:hypothetical protein
MKLITEAPSWFLLLCLLSGAGISLLIYFKNRRSAIPESISRWLAIIRFVAITLLAFLLLNPLIKRMTRDSELPVIIVAIDNSQSMTIHSLDSANDARFIDAMTSEFQQELGKKFQVDLFTFGEEVSDTTLISFAEKQTDISSMFSAIENRYAGRNVGAMVMITDGIYNKGQNPLHFTDRLNLPVYSVMWGDTTRKRDLVLAEVNYNRIAYLGNTFPMEVVVKASGALSVNSRLIVRNREKVLHSIPFSIDSDPYVKIFQLSLLAEKEGIMDFEILLEPIPDEVTLVNNRTRAFVEVLSGKKRVLLLSSKPHPDIGAIHNALAFNEQLETEVVLVNDFRMGEKPWDLVVLHQIPDDQRSLEIYNRFVEKRTPKLIIGGGNTRSEVLTATGAAPSIARGNVRDRYNEVTGTLNQGFALFTPNTAFTDQLPELPPLYVPFGRTEPLPGEQPLVFQQIGRVATAYPLISFNAVNGTRTCYIGGEGIWRWRMYSYRNLKTHHPFDTFVQQMVQYLTAADDRTRFRVSAAGFFNETEQIHISAELYDAAYNPVTDPEVQIRIDGSDNLQYDFTFSRKERNYSLDVGRLPVGEYRYNATTTLGNERLTASGKFVVSPMNHEATITMADHPMLINLSHQTGGMSLLPLDYQEIINHIKARSDIKPVSHLREKFTDLTSVTWILFLIILLLAAEWFVRKREGDY